MLLRIPAAERAVARHRIRVGVPAHVTIAYPFKPADLLTSIDLEALTQLFARFQPMTVTFPTTAWFGDDVLYLEPSNPEPLTSLITAVEDAFPTYPVYGGAHVDVRPHLTVGHAHGRDALTAVERDLLNFLPVEQLVSGVELWTGPALSAGLGSWAHIQTFPLHPARVATEPA